MNAAAGEYYGAMNILCKFPTELLVNAIGGECHGAMHMLS